MAQSLEERRSNNSFRILNPADSSLIDFCSNDYLGFARSPELLSRVEAEWQKLKSEKSVQLIGSGGSRLLAGDSEYAEALEKELAAFYKSESGLLFNSGYAANTGIFSCIPKRGDTILYDEFIHASMRDGIRLSPARSWAFRHNDLQQLEELLAKAEGTIFIAAESVYSMDGDTCPLPEMLALTEKFKAALILDEAHSNGIYAADGSGLAVELQCENRIFARIMTFGKAAGAHGAFVAGSSVLRNYLINFSRPFIYSTALPLHDLAVIRMAVQYFSETGNLRTKLQSLVNYFRSNANGIPLLQSDSAIQGILVSGNENARNLAAKCKAAGFDLRAVLSPTVPEGKERLRLILHAFNSEAEIDQLIKIIGESV